MTYDPSLQKCDLCQLYENLRMGCVDHSHSFSIFLNANSFSCADGTLTKFRFFFGWKLFFSY